MLRVQDLDLVIVQLTVFTPNVSVFSAPRALTTVLGKYANFYDGNVQALPLPEEIPPEFPRIVLQSKDEVYKLEISPARVNSYWMHLNKTQAKLKNIISTCSETLQYYVESMETEVNRLALVVTHTCKAEKPAFILAEQFCKPNLKDTIFKGSENFEIHNHSIKQVKNFSFNAWIRCKTGFFLINNVQYRGVVIEQDLNTLVEVREQHKFTTEDINKYFLDTALAEVEETLQLYFPNSN